jgi:hypothetical protein
VNPGRVFYRFYSFLLQTPPSDIVAVDSADKIWMFYITPNNKLAYLRNSTPTGDGLFTPFAVKVDCSPIAINPVNKQIAAVALVYTWNCIEDLEVTVIMFSRERGEIF